MTRRRDDRGATAVEFSLVVLPFMALVFGSVDFGLYEYQHSQAAAGARDGLRYAILHYQSAESGTDYTAIKTAVTDRLGIRNPAPTVTVSCSTSPCSSATVGEDTITVQVKLVYQPITPGLSKLGAAKTITESATQTIVGLPS